MFIDTQSGHIWKEMHFPTPWSLVFVFNFRGEGVHHFYNVSLVSDTTIITPYLSWFHFYHIPISHSISFCTFFCFNDLSPSNQETTVVLTGRRFSVIKKYYITSPRALGLHSNWEMYTTSAEVTPNGALVRESSQNGWNIQVKDLYEISQISRICPPRKLTWLAEKTPFLRGDTSTQTVGFPAIVMLELGGVTITAYPSIRLPK